MLRGLVVGGLFLAYWISVGTSLLQHASIPRQCRPRQSRLASTSSLLETIYRNSTANNLPYRMNSFTSPALQHYTDTILDLGEAAATVVLEETADMTDGQRINSLVFEIQTPNSAQSQYLLAILAESDRVHVEALQSVVRQTLHDDDVTIALAPSLQVECLCGFGPGTVPPVGTFPPPLLTIVDESLTSCSVLWGGGGLPGRATRLTGTDWLARPKVQTGRFAMDTVTTTRTTTLSPTKRPLPESANEAAATTARARTTLPTNEPVVPVQAKPYFAVAPPDQEACRAILEDAENANPLQPIAVSCMGRIGKVRRLARRLAFCDFLPPDDRVNANDDDTHPWQNPAAPSSSDNAAMAVQLVAGKTVCDNYSNIHDEDETVGGDVLDRLVPGTLVLIRGSTNVQSRDSVRNWVTKQSLDIVVSSFELLESTFASSSPGTKEPTDKKKSSQIENGHSSFKRPTPIASPLRIRDVYGQEASAIVSMVDSLESIQEFRQDLSQLDDSQVTGLVGLDCEWLPNMHLVLPSDPQPVLLMQVCVHSLKKVYLFDMQTLLRPLLPPTANMNPLEAATCQATGALFGSRRLVKVGFQLVHDLRRLAASYPHVPSFQEVHAVLEASTFGKKALNQWKERNARMSTSSLSRFSFRFLGKGLCKEEQCSDWSQRPLSEEQMEYAALDAIVTPAIVESLLEQMDASPGSLTDDPSYSRPITSWRFLFFESNDATALKRIGAKRVLQTHVATQNWVTGEEAPRTPELPKDREGPFTDIHGVLRVPTSMISIAHASSNVDDVVGELVGKSKEKCLALLTNNGSEQQADSSKLDYPQRSGYVEFQDGVALFVNMPTKSGGGRPRSYPNEWLDDGRVLTWFLRESEWKRGMTPLAKKLLGSKDTTPLVTLFVRLGSGTFLCCGRVAVAAGDASTTGDEVVEDWSLVRVHLRLLGWPQLSESRAFQGLVSALYDHEASPTSN